jgi:PhnB protein
MQINPYLIFNGECEAAFKFYEQCLGGKIIIMMTHAGSPMAAQTPAVWQNKILHATLLVGDKRLQGSDAPPDRYETPRGISVTLGIENLSDAERIFNALATNGTVGMPLQETFWALRFGMVVDRFGIPWLINCERPR